MNAKPNLRASKRRLWSTDIAGWLHVVVPLCPPFTGDGATEEGGGHDGSSCLDSVQNLRIFGLMASPNAGRYRMKQLFNASCSDATTSLARPA